VVPCCARAAAGINPSKTPTAAKTRGKCLGMACVYLVRVDCVCPPRSILRELGRHRRRVRDNACERPYR
jgi:hypothetical protein